MRVSIDTAVQRREVTKVVSSKFPQGVTAMAHIWGRRLDMLSPYGSAVWSPITYVRHQWAVGKGREANRLWFTSLRASGASHTMSLRSCSPTCLQLVRPPEIH